MNEQENGNGGAVMVRPQGGQLIGLAAEERRAVAEIQSALTVAANRPRNEVACIERVKNACQRKGLAEHAEYSYSRGGTEITGPTIDLLTVIANYWGNIWFGFRELMQANGESTVEAYAWDLETNAKRSVTFTVPHKRVTKSSTYTLTDPRDIYEHVANHAQRRVRACLEAVVPPDVVEDAVNECRKTLAVTHEVNTKSVSECITYFGKFGITREALEKRIGRRLESMQPAQLAQFYRIHKSLKDGMSKASDWFELAVEQEPKSAIDATKDALRKRTEQSPAKPPEPPGDLPQAPEETAPPEPVGDDESPSIFLASVVAEIRKKIGTAEALSMIRANEQALGDEWADTLKMEQEAAVEAKKAKRGKPVGQMFPDAAGNPA